MPLDSDAGTYDSEVRRFRELCDTLVHSQHSKEKLRICESVARAEFYTAQVMVGNDWDSIDRIDSHEELNFAKHRFKLSLQVPNRLWRLPKWVTLHDDIVTPEEFLIWNWIETVIADNRYSIHDWAVQWYKMKTSFQLEVLCLRILRNFHKSDTSIVLPAEEQSEIDRLNGLDPLAVKYQYMLWYSNDGSSNKRLKNDSGTYSRLEDVSLYRIATDKVADYLLELQSKMDNEPNVVIRIHQVPIRCCYPELFVNPFVDDDRPIPTDSDGHQISVFFTKWYLDHKVKEWIALGGVRDWLDGVDFCERGGGAKCLRLFYWDLWADVATFRKEAKIVHRGLTKLSSMYKKYIVMSSCSMKLLF